MGFGSNIAVENAEADYREDCANLIAEKAAGLVAARDMGREEAIQKIVEWLRQEIVADSDETGTMAIENDFPSPSKAMPRRQIVAIAAELLDAARNVAADL